MANIIIGSEFKPFSYEEMLAPVVMALQAHQELEDAYSELETKASIWDRMASEENDPVAHNTYKQYAMDLQQLADILALSGLTPGARKKMINLKSRYAKDITPIELAYARRKELQDEQRKALMLNPTLMFLRDLNHLGYESSLDRFIENPNYDYGQSYSGALLTLLVATQAAALSKELRDAGDAGLKARRTLKMILPFQYERLERHGFSPDEVIDAIARNPNASSILTNIVDSTIISSGIPNWGNAETLNRARDYANQGLWSAVGQSENKLFKDDFGMQYALLLERLNAEATQNNAKAAEKALEEAEKNKAGLGLLSYKKPKEKPLYGWSNKASREERKRHFTNKKTKDFIDLVLSKYIDTKISKNVEQGTSSILYPSEGVHTIFGDKNSELYGLRNEVVDIMQRYAEGVNKIESKNKPGKGNISWSSMYASSQGGNVQHVRPFDYHLQDLMTTGTESEKRGAAFILKAIDVYPWAAEDFDPFNKAHSGLIGTDLIEFYYDRVVDDIVRKQRLYEGQPIKNIINNSTNDEIKMFSVSVNKETSTNIKTNMIADAGEAPIYEVNINGDVLNEKGKKIVADDKWAVHNIIAGQGGKVIALLLKGSDVKYVEVPYNSRLNDFINNYKGAYLAVDILRDYGVNIENIKSGELQNIIDNLSLLDKENFERLINIYNREREMLTTNVADYAREINAKDLDR